MQRSRFAPFAPILAGLCLCLNACGKDAQTAVGKYYLGCEGAGSEGVIPADERGADGPAMPEQETPSDARALFDNRVAGDLQACASCHVAGGLADDDGGSALLLAAGDGDDDAYDALHAAWMEAGGGVGDSPLLRMASGADPAHPGGTEWPEDSVAYADVKALFDCWTAPDGCEDRLVTLTMTTSHGEVHPLLGDLEAAGGRNYAAVYCEGKPDCATLPMDPRELIAGDNIDNRDYAVYYNDPFELCQTDALFENQTRANDALIAQGKEPVYTAKPRPDNCGEWREAVERGREFIVSTPITGATLTVNSLLELATYFERWATVDEVSDVDDVNALLEAFSQQRYGWPKSPYRNPAPMPGEDPNESDGGSVQLPIALAQVKDADGRWTGELGMTCFACHVGQIGMGEVVGASAERDGHPEIYGGADNGMFLGMNGSNTDVGMSLWDLEQANGLSGPDAFNAILSNPTYMTNRSRGVNAADQEILTLLAGRVPDTLDWRSPLFAPPQGKGLPSPTATGGGDQDVPSWWWTHNKTRYLWVGYGSAGSSRGNFFPASTNPFDGHWSKHREGDFQDMDMWLNAVEAPAYVGPAIDEALAEQGAVLFHMKDLWAEDGNADIPKPPGGNGSCASCHGAYSPHYVHMQGFLPDPSLAGMSGYTVPLDIVGTDPAQSNVFNLMGRDRESTTSISGTLWMGYPDAQEGYLMPEERSEGEAGFPGDLGSIPGRQCGLGAMGGYTAQPLHGVWASAPYFHNGSVPTVWGVLDPDARPEVWRRQQVPEAEASVIGDRGYDTRLDRAYDYDELGWKYDVLACDDAEDAPYAVTCTDGRDVDTEPDVDSAVDDRTIFNTHGLGKGNGGHAWTKVLTEPERRALLEYLKTL